MSSVQLSAQLCDGACLHNGYYVQVVLKCLRGDSVRGAVDMCCRSSSLYNAIQMNSNTSVNTLNQN